VAKWLTRWSAKPVFEGSIPSRCSKAHRAGTIPKPDGLVGAVYRPASNRDRTAVAWQVQQAMKKDNITKVEMARRMHTSRAALDRLLCSGPPMGATCSFSPTTVTPNGAAATTTLTIATAAQSSGLAWPYGPDSRSDSRGAWTLALLAGGGSWLFGRRRKNIPWTRFWIEWIEYPVANLFSHRDRNSRIRVADGCLQPDRAVR